WSYQDAESLTFADNSFDMVMACAGLHHCHSPHRALLEMYRVARHCALALEARDSFLSRIAVHLGVVDEYELTAVVGNDYAFGGVKNTSVPNYIYRCTEREVIKTISSYAPYAPSRVLWFHEFAPPIANLKGQIRQRIAHPLRCFSGAMAVNQTLQEPMQPPRIRRAQAGPAKRDVPMVEAGQ